MNILEMPDEKTFGSTGVLQVYLINCIFIIFDLCNVLSWPQKGVLENRRP